MTTRSWCMGTSAKLFFTAHLVTLQVRQTDLPAIEGDDISFSISLFTPPPPLCTMVPSNPYMTAGLWEGTIARAGGYQHSWKPSSTTKVRKDVHICAHHMCIVESYLFCLLLIHIRHIILILDFINL